MKIGVYGGSFNPPHLGHMAAAESAAKYLGLDELLLIPAGIPPHKMLSADAAGADDRLAMTRLMGEQIALDTGVKVTVSDMEIARGGKSYTADTLRILHEEHPDDELWLLMGTDMFLTFQYCTSRTRSCVMRACAPLAARKRMARSFSPRSASTSVSAFRAAAS